MMLELMIQKLILLALVTVTSTIDLGISTATAQGAGSVITLAPGPRRDLEITTQTDGTLEVTLGSGHPHFWTGVVTAPYDPSIHTVLTLDYFAPSGFESVVLRYRVASGEMAVAEVVTVPIAEAWQPLTFDLSQLEVPPASGHPEMRFHFALNGPSGTTIRLRNLKLRTANEHEIRLSAEKDRIQALREADASAILEDLRRDYSARLTTVQIDTNSITLAGHSPRPFRVVGISPAIPSHQASTEHYETEGTSDVDGNFSLTLPRADPATERDRSLWRWRISDVQGNWLSAASWPTQYNPAIVRPLHRLTAPSIKGIGGVPAIHHSDHPIFELGVHHATINLVLNSLIRDTPIPNWIPWQFDQQTFYINERQLKNHDATIRHLSDRDVIVSAILLVGNGRDADGNPHSLMTHPEADSRGIYSLPNVTTDPSSQLYSAALYLMAERWSRTDGSNGRISNWIMHNEIDQAATWTNMGSQPLSRYLETYMRSARLMHHTARLFDPHSRVFISLTHHWAKKSSGSGTYVVRDMLELFAEMGRIAGDFPWGVAYHPYPRDLRNPDAWNDQGITNEWDTPYIVPKNLNVLPAFLNQSHLLYAGQPRGILFSEQGFNSPTLSIEDQRRQAAGLIYMFRQMKGMPTVEAFHLHRYQDMPDAEGGLRLGLLTETGDRKLAWEVYQAIGTEAQPKYEVFADDVMRQTSKENQ